MGARDFRLSLRQLDRWFANEISTLPRPSVCKVIEAEFGHPAELLLGPDNAVLASTHRTAADQLDRELRTVDLVSWIADKSRSDFHDVYVEVVKMADQLSAVPPAVRAADEHARSVLTRASIAEAVERYYGSPITGFYSATIERGPAISLTVLTNPRWIDLAIPLDSQHEMIGLSKADPESSRELAPVEVRAAIKRIASIEIGQTVLLNNSLYRLTDLIIDANSIAATLGMTSFAAYALTADLLEVELIDSLVDTRNGGPQADLPLRNLYLPTISSATEFENRLCAGGPVCLLAIARDEDYLLLIQERSSRVINVAGRLAVIPKAFHQPLNELGETALSASIERELEEELLGRQDLEQISLDAGRRAAPRHPRSVSEPMRWLLDHPDDFHLQCTGFGINMLSGNYEFSCLVIIDNPEWWRSYGDRVEANWEAMRLRSYSSQDCDGQATLIGDPKWSNEGLFALLQGLRRLAQHNPTRTRVPDIEVRV